MPIMQTLIPWTNDEPTKQGLRIGEFEYWTGWNVNGTNMLFRKEYNPEFFGGYRTLKVYPWSPICSEWLQEAANKLGQPLTVEWDYTSSTIKPEGWES